MKFVATAFLLFFSGVAYGAPTISGVTGTISDGNSVVIAGADFGAKTTAAPIKFENFEDGVSGTSVTQTSYWSIESDEDANYAPQFSNENARHALTSLCAKVWLNETPGAGQHDVFYKGSLDFSSGYAYVDFWARFDSGEVTGNGGDGSISYQIKLWRMAYGLPTTDPSDYPSIANFNWQHTDHTSKSYYYTLTRQDVSTLTDYGVTYNEDAWNHIQAIYYFGTQGGYDANLYVVNNYATQVSTESTNVYTGANRITGLQFGEYVGNYTSIETAPIEYFDDIYIDNSWARVELGDNATYASCTHREIQIPSEWADGQVTVTFNQGSYSTDDTVYFFICDSSGACSSGYESTVGGVGSGSPGVSNSAMGAISLSGVSIQ